MGDVDGDADRGGDRDQCPGVERRLLLDATAAQLPAVAARDRALLLVGWSCALRRSELGALTVDDVVDDGDGLRVTVRRSKADQHGGGQVLEVPYGRHVDTCPVRAWRAWQAFGVGEPGGPAFPYIDRWGHPSARGLSGGGGVVVLRRLAEQAGLDPGRSPVTASGPGSSARRCAVGCRTRT